MEAFMILDVQIQFKITSISNSIARILHILSGLYHKSRGVSRSGQMHSEGRKKWSATPTPKRNKTKFHQGQKPTILNHGAYL